MSFLSLFQSLPTITVLVFFVLILGIAAYFLYAYKKEEELAFAEEKNLADYEKILLRAHKKARIVVEKASKKAQKLLEKTTDFDRDALSLLTRSLQQETDTMIRDYHNNLVSTAQSESATMRNAVVDMEKITQKEIQAYTKSLQQTLVVSQDKINQEIVTDVAKAKEEIEKYKTDRLAKAEEEISAKVNQLALQIFGQALSMDEHEKLIVDSLKKAKEEGLFSD